MSRENRGTKKTRKAVPKKLTDRCKETDLSCPDTGKQKYRGDGKTAEGGERKQRE